MTAKQTSNLRTANGKIRHTYDYERLSEIVYPKNIYNRVTYNFRVCESPPKRWSVRSCGSCCCHAPQCTRNP